MAVSGERVKTQFANDLLFVILVCVFFQICSIKERFKTPLILARKNPDLIEFVSFILVILEILLRSVDDATTFNIATKLLTFLGLMFPLHNWCILNMNLFFKSFLPLKWRFDNIEIQLSECSIRWIIIELLPRSNAIFTSMIPSGIEKYFMLTFVSKHLIEIFLSLWPEENSIDAIKVIKVINEVRRTWVSAFTMMGSLT